MTDKELVLELFKRLGVETNSSNAMGNGWTADYEWESAIFETNGDSCEMMFTFEKDGSFRGDGYDLYDAPIAEPTDENVETWMGNAGYEDLLWAIRLATSHLENRF